MEHLTTEELEAFVAGEAGSDPDRVREHVRRCATCAQRLAAESQLDTDLRLAADRLVRDEPVTIGRRAPARLRPPEAIAIAAGLLAISLGTLWLRQPPQPDQTPPASRASFPLIADAPGLQARNDLGPGFELLPAAEAFRDTGSDSPGMRARWDNLAGASGDADSQWSGSRRLEPSEP